MFKLNLYSVKLLAVFFLSAGLLSGCGAKESADMAYPNSMYSYDGERAFSCGSWTPYDEEYLKQLREDYKLDDLVRGCKDDFEKIGAVTKWVTNLW